MSDNSSDSSSYSEDGGGVSLLETPDSIILVPRLPRDEPVMQSTSAKKPELVTSQYEIQSTKPISVVVPESHYPLDNVPENLQMMVTPATTSESVSNQEPQNNNGSRSEGSTSISKSPECGLSPPAKNSEPSASTNDVHQTTSLSRTVANVAPQRGRASTWTEMENRALAASVPRRGYATRILDYLLPGVIRESWGRMRHQPERRQREDDHVSDDD